MSTGLNRRRAAWWCALFGIACLAALMPPGCAAPATSVGPRQSSPIALTDNNRALVSVNPDAKWPSPPRPIHFFFCVPS